MPAIVFELDVDNHNVFTDGNVTRERRTVSEPVSVELFWTCRSIWQELMSLAVLTIPLEVCSFRRMANWQMIEAPASYNLAFHFLKNVRKLDITFSLVETYRELFPQLEHLRSFLIRTHCPARPRLFRQEEPLSPSMCDYTRSHVQKMLKVEAITNYLLIEESLHKAYGVGETASLADIRTIRLEVELMLCPFQERVGEQYFQGDAIVRKILLHPSCD